MNIENTLYHGSKNNFNEFEIPKYHTNGGTLGFGTYLTDSIERANSYADTNGYLYTVELTDELSQSQPLNATKVTLTLNNVDVGGYLFLYGINDFFYSSFFRYLLERF